MQSAKPKVWRPDVVFYLDHNVPATIATGLRLRGIDVITSQEDGTTTLDDNSLLDRATSLERILFTQDEDLLAIARSWQQTGVDFAGVAYAH